MKRWLKKHPNIIIATIGFGCILLGMFVNTNVEPGHFLIVLGIACVVLPAAAWMSENN